MAGTSPAMTKKEKHGYFGLKGAQVPPVRLKRRILGCVPKAAN
jgi:hypothetical protein